MLVWVASPVPSPVSYKLTLWKVFQRKVLQKELIWLYFVNNSQFTIHNIFLKLDPLVSVNRVDSSVCSCTRRCIRPNTLKTRQDCALLNFYSINFPSLLELPPSHTNTFGILLVAILRQNFRKCKSAEHSPHDPRLTKGSVTESHRVSQSPLALTETVASKGQRVFENFWPKSQLKISSLSRTRSCTSQTP